jgi:hypothetical protein
VTKKTDTIRGSALSNLGECENRDVGKQGVDLVGQTAEVALIPSTEPLDNGPVLVGLVSRSEEESERAGEHMGGDSDQTQHIDKRGLVRGTSVIDKLEALVGTNRGKKHVASGSFQLEDSNLSSSSTLSPLNYLLKPSTSNIVRPRKSSHKLPFPSLVGPKCLRLVEMVNCAGANNRRKKIGREDESKKASSNPPIGIGEDAVDEGVAVLVDEADEETLEESPEFRSIQHPTTSVIDAAVVMQGSTAPNSGVNFLMGEEDLQDVDGYALNRKGPEACKLEAEAILEIQSDLGLCFVEGREKNVALLVELEERDKARMVRDEEVQGSQ